MILVNMKLDVSEYMRITLHLWVEDFIGHVNLKRHI